MTSDAKAARFVRWHLPYLTRDERSEYWTAQLKYRLTEAEHRVGLETAVHGPTEDACRAEMHRQDRAWAEYPLRVGDHDKARDRLRFLAGGAA